MPFPPAALDALDDLHRDCLVALVLDPSWAMSPIASKSRSAWQDAVGRAGITGPRDRKLYGEAFKAIVQHTVDAGAAVRTRNQEYLVSPGILAPLLDDAHRRGVLLRLAGQMIGRDEATHYLDHRTSRPLLVALATGQSLERALAPLLAPHRTMSERGAFLVDVVGVDIPPAWLGRLPPSLLPEYLKVALRRLFLDASPIGPAVREAAVASDDAEVRARVVTLLCLCGETESAREVLAACGTSQWERSARAFAALTEGRLLDARQLFRDAAVGSRKQRVELPDYLAAFDLLLTVTSEFANEAADTMPRIKRATRQLGDLNEANDALRDLAIFRQTGRCTEARVMGRSWLDVLVCALRDTWTGQESGAKGHIPKHRDRARANGYAWLARQLERIEAGDARGSLVALFERKEGWELALDSLVSVGAEDATRREPRADGGGEGLAVWWTVSLSLHSRATQWMEIEAHLAKKCATKGKRLSIWKADDDPTLPLDDHDRRVVARYLGASDGYAPGRSISVLPSLVAHPRVRDAAGTHLRVERGEPTLHVVERPDGAVLRLSPASFGDDGLAVDMPERDRIVVYERTGIAARVHQILGGAELHVPTRGLARMSDAIAALGSGLKIDAARSVARDGGVADARLRVQLFRSAGGLRARVRVIPGGASGPALRPGQPPAEIMIGSGGGLVRLTRDLAVEAAHYEALLGSCPTLASLPQDGDDRIARDLETCLEVLLELRKIESVVVEWPEGQSLRLPSMRDSSNMKIHVRTNEQWLAVDGHMQLEDARVVEMRELLASASRAVGRFVPIGEDEYVALTGDLRSRLDALARLDRMGKNGRIATALLGSIDGILAGLDVSFSDDLAKRRAALESAWSLSALTPRDLAAELRDYQREGFLFLMRRAEVGLGACLADDMGLGKTVQALALLLHRRKKGPALVVAPTSVCRNWEDEARRFAPALALHRLAEGDRAACVRDAKSDDVVIASYGLLATEGALLASRTWSTIVYDEAHALKNASTRRWSAARDLKSDATVALTGTPVENHAGELHALFDLIVPGLLGTRAHFDKALGAPIAAGDREAAALLRQIVRPFVLRRTKAQVLSELPPKTELLQVVSASEEHRAFYEAVRQRAVEKVEKARKAGGAQAARAGIELLAELTRLRRAAIDPRLVAGDGAPAGSKLDALVELVMELREEGRRALVFSQFLEVLDLARARLEERGVECRRLDGTMSAGARAAEVAAFQGGKGDVFLVSLKAGGVGMNLTAADVVILLDPWWNPAVEDQASSRAHRMGQARPVTVVRIVTEGTIEEKVLSMHAKKRQLFDDVVTDADGGGTLDIETLAGLLG